MKSGCPIFDSLVDRRKTRYRENAIHSCFEIAHLLIAERNCDRNSNDDLHDENLKYVMNLVFEEYYTLDTDESANIIIVLD